MKIFHVLEIEEPTTDLWCYLVLGTPASFKMGHAVYNSKHLLLQHKYISTVDGAKWYTSVWLCDNDWSVQTRFKEYRGKLHYREVMQLLGYSEGVLL